MTDLKCRRFIASLARFLCTSEGHVLGAELVDSGQHNIDDLLAFFPKCPRRYGESIDALVVIGAVGAELVALGGERGEFDFNFL